jgi:hypothetical protein
MVYIREEDDDNKPAEKYVVSLEQNPTNTIVATPNSVYDIDMEEYTIPPTNYVENLPKNFDGREVWQGIITGPDNQYKCGSCWAFSSAACLSDRFNIQSMGKLHVTLSPVRMVICYQKNPIKFDPEFSSGQNSYENIFQTYKYGCHGNTLLHTWKFLKNIGTNTTSCISYSGRYKFFKDMQNYQSDDDLLLCSNLTSTYSDMCVDYYYDKKAGLLGGTPAQFYRTKNVRHIPGTKDEFHITDYKNIQQEIYKWGPVTSAMIVYKDFYTFKTDKIYKWNGVGNPVGGHAIEIVGWGETEAGETYWIIKNSWGPTWGDGGYFKMVSGINHCGIEENVMVGQPDFWQPREIDEQKIFPQFNGGIVDTDGYSRRTHRLFDIEFKAPLENYNVPKSFVAGDPTTWIEPGSGIAMASGASNSTGGNCMIIYIIIGIVLFILFFIIFFKNMY